MVCRADHRGSLVMRLRRRPDKLCCYNVYERNEVGRSDHADLNPSTLIYFSITKSERGKEAANQSIWLIGGVALGTYCSLVIDECW